MFFRLPAAEAAFPALDPCDVVALGAGEARAFGVAALIAEEITPTAGFEAVAATVVKLVAGDPEVLTGQRFQFVIGDGAARTAREHHILLSLGNRTPRLQASCWQLWAG